MACYTITVTVPKMHPELLADALKAAGFSVKLDGGTVVFSRSTEFLYHSYHNKTLYLKGADYAALANEVKRAYSAQIIQTAGEETGWKVIQSQPQQYVAKKRR